jgi:hypothetical protein
MSQATGTSRQGVRAAGRPAPAVSLVLLCLLLLLIGCHAESPRPAVNTDPLLGPVGVQPAATPGISAVSPTPAPAGPLPALPVPGSATSNAALAPGWNQTLDPNRELRISDNPAGAGAPAWRGPGDVTLSQPQPANSSLAARTDVRPLPPAPVTPAAPAAPVYAPPPVTARGASPEASLLAQVTARGAKYQVLQTWGESGAWKFTCAIPNRQNPNIRRTYEAQAGDPSSAIQAVLDQIDHEQR